MKITSLTLATALLLVANDHSASAYVVDVSSAAARQRSLHHHHDGGHKSPALLDTTKLGSLTVPSVGIGTISWSSTNFATLENEELQQVVDLAYTSNGAFLDTAERYGSHMKTALGLGYHETEELSQKMLQRAQQVHGSSATEPVIATKFTPTPWRTTVESVVDACEASRQSLGVDQIDLYQIHMPDIVKPFRFLGQDESFDKIYWDGLAECYHRGLVKNVGVCNYGPTLLAQCQDHLGKKGVPLASNQIGYSLLGRHNGAQQTLDWCKDAGIEVLAFYPFAMGLLTGKYSSKQATKDASIERSLLRSKKSMLEMTDLMRYAKGDGKLIPQGGVDPLLAVMERIAEERQKTVAQVALNYIICKGAIPIPGVRSVAQLQDNLGAMGWRLTEDEIAMLELVADQLGFGFDGAGFKRTSEKFVGYGVEKFSLT
eukprot:CAMPEP_0119553912 /NCGR_PEP_ID=MMETSP1352-20130426/6529_1 /TAXON_ID=265584 /ORGANISM="Stauroneis constricta, Strain CCMP1120" /LENGTH=429 /DNA_ID=CAMNT_0007600395 /DNA_START=148 /DNA_END=1437 /DNA_ORIENTATION=-